MKLDDAPESGNVEDSRVMGTKLAIGGVSRAGGIVHPEKFTHGTSDRRVKWFKDGLRTGDVSKKKLDYFFDVRSSKEL